MLCSGNRAQLTRLQQPMYREINCANDCLFSVKIIKRILKLCPIRNNFITKKCFLFLHNVKDWRVFIYLSCLSFNCCLLQDMLLDEKTGCLLKFSGELEDVSREDFHELFSGHGKIKWVDFTRGAKEVKNNLPLKNCSVKRCGVVIN